MSDKLYPPPNTFSNSTIGFARTPYTENMEGIDVDVIVDGKPAHEDHYMFGTTTLSCLAEIRHKHKHILTKIKVPSNKTLESAFDKLNKNALHLIADEIQIEIDGGSVMDKNKKVYPISTLSDDQLKGMLNIDFVLIIEYFKFVLKQFETHKQFLSLSGHWQGREVMGQKVDLQKMSVNYGLKKITIEFNPDAKYDIKMTNIYMIGLISKHFVDEIIIRLKNNIKYSDAYESMLTFNYEIVSENSDHVHFKYKEYTLIEKLDLITKIIPNEKFLGEFLKDALHPFSGFSKEDLIKKYPMIKQSLIELLY